MDPLRLFLSEKIAAKTEKPSVIDRSRGIEPSKTSDDPGERALAGIAAVSGHMLTRTVPPVGGLILAAMAREGSAEVPNMVRKEVSRLSEFDIGKPNKPTPFMGLFDIKPRRYATRAGQLADNEAIQPFAYEVRRNRDLVDSFIDKHKLADKGVRIRFTGNWLHRALGPSYNVTNKLVTMPEMSAPSMLHELGHAADYTSGRMGRFRRAFEAIGGRAALIGVPAALIAGDEIKKMFPGTIDDKVVDFAQEHAPEITAATLAATTLYPEAKASAYAIKHIAQQQGRDAAIHAAKKLIPAYGTYLLGVIPAVVGMSLARKYMRQARDEKDESGAEKTAGAVDRILRAARSKARNIAADVGEARDFISMVGQETGADIANIGREIGSGTVDLLKDKDLPRRLTQAARTVGTSPEFAWGALTSAVPAATGALYLYGSQPGHVIRSRMGEERSRMVTGKDIGDEELESWRERHPARFAGLVALGAALSGGVLTKMFSDIGRAL